VAEAIETAFAPVTDVTYRIEGGSPLVGDVSVGGAKNAIGKLLVASLLTDEPCTFHNVQRIGEIDLILAMLKDIGTEHEWVDANTLRVQTPFVRSNVVSQRYTGLNRAPILMLSPLHHRTGGAIVPTVGGDKIGPRPVNFHLEALREFGAIVEESPDGYTVSGPRLTGTTIELAYPSVGATETAILAATLAQGTSVIHNAAIEPEITDTILFLQKMGALISVEVDRSIVVEGVERLRGATHTVITDRIQTASFGAAAVATNGRVTVHGAQQEHLITFLNTLRRAGGGFEVTDDGITFFRDRDLGGVYVDTDVHPGFMTDWQQPFVVMLTQASGVSIVHETVYEDRFGYVNALQQMGADIELTTTCLGSKPCRFVNRNHTHSCVIRGPSRLRGIKMEMPDLRAGFAYVIAALVAEGTSEIGGIHYIERGYSDVPEKLRAMGAQLEVVQ
jgi:UDP-N-acetylglucosamine 1-carboxyvinyltransferase